MKHEELKPALTNIKMKTTTATAPELLGAAAEVMEQRGKDYDQPGGERSMKRIVTAFNAITGLNLTETQGWEFMESVKAVRTYIGKQYHEDSMKDKIAYAALKMEAAMAENACAGK